MPSTICASARGTEHEAAFLHALLAQGREVVTIELGEDRDFEEAAARTAAAMRAGAEYVYQAVLVLDGWRGIADFLERVERPSALGPWSYEVLDTKLARHARPSHALQLCFYSEAVAADPGPGSPIAAPSCSGRASAHVLRLADVTRTTAASGDGFRDAVGRRPATQPYRCDHCRICDSAPALQRLVGGARPPRARGGHAPRPDRALRRRPASGRSRRSPRRRRGRRCAKLAARDVRGTARAGGAPASIAPERAELVQRLRPGRGQGAVSRRCRPRRRATSSSTSRDDTFFEPARGLEFLFGLLLREDGERRYEAIWAHDRESEREALERFVDLVHERLARWPDLHVYHYGCYEPSAAQAADGGVRDARARGRRRCCAGGVFVDLYTTVRQALRVGVPELLAQGGGGARRLRARRRRRVRRRRRRRLRALAARPETARCSSEIAAYNEEDCRATLALRDWLLGLRPPDLAWPEPIAAAEVSEEKQEAIEARAQICESTLVEGERAGRRRRSRASCSSTTAARRGPAGGASSRACSCRPRSSSRRPRRSAASSGPASRRRRENRSSGTLRLPRAGAQARGRRQRRRPGDGQGSGRDRRAGRRDACTLRLQRGPSLAEVPLPRALVGGAPYDDGDPAGRGHARRRVDSATAAAGTRRSSGLLAREPPRVAGRAAGARDADDRPRPSCRRSRPASTQSYLFVQGPPGTGKTWRGARLIVHLIRAGKRVGVTAQSHKVIHNLLDEVERVAPEEGVDFPG